MKTIQIKKLERDGLQARATMCESAVTDYGEALANGGPPMPPVTVYTDGSRYWLADGFHRVEAANRKGIKSLSADILTGTRADALWHAIGANKAHGLRRSNDDKRKAVQMALAERPEMSDRAIAQHCGVSDHLVADVRGSTANSRSCKAPRIGLDGKKRSIPAENKKRDFGPPPDSGARKTEPEPVKDEIGRVIPEALIDTWSERGGIGDMLRSLSAVRGWLRQAQEQGGGALAGCSFGRALAGLDNAYSEIKASKPYTVCPTCQGLRPQSCKVCVGVGFIGKHKWDTVISQELKDIILKGVA